MLGRLLVERHGLVNETDLERALTRQRKTREPLGGIFVDMGLITRDQLAQVLAEQDAYWGSPTQRSRKG